MRAFEISSGVPVSSFMTCCVCIDVSAIDVMYETVLYFSEHYLEDTAVAYDVHCAQNGVVCNQINA